jgi:hypothetical protein
MLTGLTIFGDTSLELASTRSDDKNGAVGLRGSSNHVLDKVTMSRGICREQWLASLSNLLIYCDTLDTYQ